MTTYWEPEFVNALKDVDVKVVFEAGARTGEETIMLSNIFPNANVYSFECNPMVVHVTRAALVVAQTYTFFHMAWVIRMKVCHFIHSWMEILVLLLSSSGQTFTGHKWKPDTSI